MVISFNAGATVPTVEEEGEPRIAVILLILNGALSQERNMVSNIHFCKQIFSGGFDRLWYKCKNQIIGRNLRIVAH